MNRPDFRTAQIFRAFIEIEEHLTAADSKSQIFEARKIAEIKELKLGARDAIHLKEKGLLFVAMSEMNISSRVDSYITNVSYFAFIFMYSFQCHGMRKRQPLPPQLVELYAIELKNYKQSKMTPPKKTICGDTSRSGVRASAFRLADYIGNLNKTCSTLASMTAQSKDSRFQSNSCPQK